MEFFVFVFISFVWIGLAIVTAFLFTDSEEETSKFLEQDVKQIFKDWMEEKKDI